MKESLDEQSRQSLIGYRQSIRDNERGLLDIEHGKTFSRLFEIRHSGDYDDFVYCDKEMIDEFTPKAMAFIDEIKNLLAK